jgi:hypothetical protein
MSISNLFNPNDYDLFANSLTTTGQISGQAIYRIDYNNLADQSVPNNTSTTVSFPTNLVQSNFPATLPVTVYTAPIAGLYLITYTISLSNSNGIGYCQAYIKRQNSGYGYGVCSSRYFEASALTPGPPVSGITLASDGIPLSGSAVLPLVAGEQVQILVYQNSGVTQTLTISQPNTQIISIYYLHS